MGKLGRFFTPITVLKFLLTIGVIVISSIVVSGNVPTITGLKLNGIAQLLLILLLITNGIISLKDADMAKRRSAYLYFLGAFVMLAIDTMTFTRILHFL